MEVQLDLFSPARLVPSAARGWQQCGAASDGGVRLESDGPAAEARLGPGHVGEQGVRPVSGNGLVVKEETAHFWFVPIPDKGVPVSGDGFGEQPLPGSQLR